MNTQISQYINHDFNTGHPLIHTLFLGIFHDLFGTPNKGYALATLIQMVIVDCSITYGLNYIFHRNRNRTFYMLCVIFYALFPPISLLAISHTKDIFFSAFASIFFIDSLRLVRCEISSLTVPTYIRIVTNATLMSLFRNNAIYALIATLLILFFIYLFEKKERFNTKIIKTYIIIIACITLMALVSSKVLFIATNSVKGSAREMMSVPAQIMGHVYNTSATEAEKRIILEYVTAPENYLPYLSDPLKAYLPFYKVTDSMCKHFLVDTAKIIINHPIDSVIATYQNSIQGYFSLFNSQYSSKHFYLAAYENEYCGNATLSSQLPWLYNIYVTHFHDTERMVTSPFIIFFNLGLYVWTLIIAFLLSLKQGMVANKYIPFLFPVLYLCTLLLGPASIIRYGYLYILIAPMCLILISSDSQ